MPTRVLLVAAEHSATLTPPAVRSLQGMVRCAGSPNFLKRLFGIGYILTCVREHSAESRAITALVQRFVPAAIVSSDVGAELAFKMPLESAQLLPALFAALDAGTSSGVEAYALSLSNMESVFLTIAREDEIAVAAAARESSTGAITPNPQAGPVAAIDVPSSAPGSLLTIAQMRKRADKVQGSAWGHFAAHFAALMQKRLRLALRTPWACCCQFVVPIIVLLIGMAVLSTAGALECWHGSQSLCTRRAVTPRPLQSSTSRPLPSTRTCLTSRRRAVLRRALTGCTGATGTRAAASSRTRRATSRR